MASIEKPNYKISSSFQLKWTATQEKGLNTDYPFADLCTETAEQYAQRNYLQFLWLPESIMPLSLLVPSMLRVKVASTSQPSSTSPHPLHALLDQLLLTAAATRNKYHVEVPHILAEEGGAGEAEENMMWFALSYEKEGEDSQETGSESPWVNDACRKKWLGRMERRETQVQILLYLLKLSLPGPTLNDLVKAKRSSKKRKQRAPKASVQSPEERLESFMDKLSTWQLLNNLDVPSLSGQSLNGHKPYNKDERDWMQVFCEDIVEPEFKTKVPSMCTLMRNKIFPYSPFSDDSSGSSSRPSSPMDVDDMDSPLAIPKKQRGRSSSGASNTNPSSRHPSPALSVTSHKSTSDRKLLNSRSRSRSLSVSLAQDARRAGSAGLGAAVKKKALNREVSMSRVFKDKPARKDSDGTSRSQSVTSQANGVDMKLKSTPQTGITLVEATPVKNKSQKRVQLQSSKSAVAILRAPSFSTSSMADDDLAEEEDWSLFSSPDVLMLGVDSVRKKRPSAGTAEHVLAVDTPAKKRGRR